MGLQAAKTIAEPPPDDSPEPNNPAEAVRQVVRTARAWRKGENYSDLT